jgi:uncharacterized protein (DUF2141 family)
MNSPTRLLARGSGALRLIVAAMAILALLPALPGQVKAAGTATITVHSYLEDGTTPLPFVRFQVTDSHGTIYGPLESAPPDGTVTFTVDVVDDSTTFEIVEETPPACGTAPDPVQVGPLADGDTSSVDIKTSFLSDCDLGSISVYSYSCPDSIDASATDYAVFRDGCPDTVDGKSYQVSEKNGSQKWDIVTGAFGISGRAPLVGLNPGTYLVKDTDPASDTQAVVFCQVYPGIPTGSSTPDSVSQAEVTDNEVSVDLNGERIACDFFAVPSSGDVSEPTQEPTTEPTVEPTQEPTQEATAEPTPDGGDGGVVEGGDSASATLEVHLSACPAGYSGSDFFGDCHDNGIEGRAIGIEGPGGFSDSMNTTLPASPGPGVARFENLDGGEYKVSEDIPGDTATYYAYCSIADSDTVVDFNYDDSTSEAIVLTLGDGKDVVCDFYIVPEQQQTETGQITVTKFTCPTGYSSDAINSLKADCTDKTAGVTFTLTPQGGSGVDKTTGDTGRVRYSNLDPGSYELSEDVPGEFSTPVVWCNVAGGEWYQKEISSTDSTTFSVDAGDDIRCSWFNLPEDLSGGGSLRIHKSICPAGLTSGYFDTCYDDTLADVTFTANGPSGYEASETTGDNGVVTFSDLNAGTYTVAETPPDGVNVAVYVVVCTRNGNTYDFNYDDSNGLKISIKIPSGTEIVCDWYNVPPAKPQPGASGSVTVIKLLCQGRTDNKYDWENDCENFGAGAEFDLTRLSNNAVLSGATSGNGKLTFPNLADGAYALDETSGNWCHAEADHVDANGNVKVQDSGNTNVYVYNCSKKVNTLPSTGVGPSGGAGGIGGVMALWGLVSVLGIVALRRFRQLRPAYATVRRAG